VIKSKKAQTIFVGSSDDIETRSIVLKGKKISYKVNGTGPPLVFVHGWIGNEDSFEFCRDAFGHYYTIYSIAWPGYGGSEYAPGFTIEGLVELLKSFINELQLGQVTLAANCLGGNVAMEFIRLYPEMVKQLILVEVHAYFPKYLYLGLIPGVSRFLFWLLVKNRVGIQFLNMFFSFQKNDENQRRLYIQEGFQRTPINSAMTFLKAIYRFSKKVEAFYLENYRTDVPVIYVEGGETFGPVADFKNLVNTYFQNLQVVSIPESIHNPVSETPELFNERVLRLLGHEPVISS